MSQLPSFRRFSLPNRRPASFAGSLTGLALAVATLPAQAESLEQLKQEIEDLKQSYEQRLDELESRVGQSSAETAASSEVPATARRRTLDNSFNPAISVILDGKYRRFSEDNGEIAGFSIEEEGERGREGFSVEETELNFSANVDNRFYGAITAAIVREEGEDIVELEEAYLQTLPGSGLPQGLTVKAGRAFWKLGYLNEHHTHEDDFVDRPLPYRVFLNKSFNDDGVEASYLLPTDFYLEAGGGLFRGDDFPAGNSDGNGPDAFSLFARTGGDIGHNQSWRAGVYYLSTKASDRDSNEGEVGFAGDVDLLAFDVRHVWAPTGNPREQELILQSEVFLRDQDGRLEIDSQAGESDDTTTGLYAQAVYKFMPEWRAGYRFSYLEGTDTPNGLIGTELDGDGHDPLTHSLMVDWTASEFSRLRLQYNREDVNGEDEDNQFVVQYILSLGAHGAHSY